MSSTPQASALPAVARQTHGEHPALGRPDDRDFIALKVAYRSSGGIERGDDVARWMESRSTGDFVSLARLIVAGEVFSFEWHRSFWIPMFQFDTADLSLLPAPRLVLVELAPYFDGWSLATWFVAPHGRLGGRRPIDLLATRLADVLAAARSDCTDAGGPVLHEPARRA